MAENVVILEPGDENAQKIAKALANPTAGDILRSLAGKNKSLSEITEELAVPLNTAKYHLENLLDAGLISVADTRYSVKGREVKYYSLTDRLLIVAPKPADVRSLLLKYASLFAIVVLGTLAFSLLAPTLGSLFTPQALGTGEVLAPAAVQHESDSNAGNAVMKAATYAATSLPAAPPVDPVLAFLLGGVLVIAVMLVYEGWLLKRRK
ncbi:MAG TPA: helix-turn-helix domain-containing protein [Methanoregula sp.]|nr:helix-turn-helix domain-containing protein [Methanoregula sp.]